MPEDLFRIVVTVAVALAAIAFLVQAFVAVALYRVIRKTQEKISPLIEKGEIVAARAVPVIEKAAPLLDKARVVVEKVGPVVEKAGPAVEQVTAILTTTHQVMEDNRPRVAEMVADGAAIVKTGREQVDRLGSLLHDASDRARTRLEQIDRTVDQTVEQVEHISETVKSAAMRPVREVSGLANGISAAVSTLVHGSRRSSVDHATQDEEMFI
jgi:methyl-accepting chemotaxis protein